MIESCKFMYLHILIIILIEFTNYLNAETCQRNVSNNISNKTLRGQFDNLFCNLINHQLSLKTIFGIKTDKLGSDNLEGFLTAVENPPQGVFPTPTIQTPKQ